METNFSAQPGQADRAKGDPAFAGAAAGNKQGTSRSLLVAAAVLAALPLILLADTALAFVRGWETRSRLDTTFLALLGIILGLTILLLLVPRGRRFLRRNCVQLVLVITFSTLTWLTLEAFTAFGLQRGQRDLYHRNEPNQKTLFRPRAEIMPGVSGDAEWTNNSLGLRGPELPLREGANRILCVGGSTTACFYLDDRETWPHLLMQHLNEAPGRRPVWVGNAGRSGYATTHHLQFIQRFDPIAEMDCVVFLVGCNDLLRWLKGLEQWEQAEQQRQQRSPLWSRSAVLGLARAAAAARNVNPLAVEDLVGESYELRRKERRAAAFSSELPDLEQALREYRQRLDAIIGVCRAKGVRPIFLTQPVLWDKDLSARGESLLWLGGLTDGRFLKTAKLREGMDRFNQELLRVCQEQRVECIDLASLSGQEAFFFDDVHLTEAGAREVARLVAERFSQSPLDSSPTTRKP